MIQYEDECVGCPPPLWCMGSACPNRNVPHYYCDECGEETEHLYEIDGEELCDICYEKRVDEPC